MIVIRDLSRALVVLAVVALAAAAPARAEQAGPSAALTQLFAAYWQDNLRLRPFLATQLGDPRYNDQFPNALSPAYKAKLRAFNERYLERARRIDAAGLAPADRLSLEVFLNAREVELAGFRFPTELQPVNQFQSLVQTFPQLGSGQSVQPFKTVKDYEDWLRRVRGLPVWTDQAIANMRLGMRRGVVLPRPLVERMIPQLETLSRDKPEDSVFYGPAKQFPETIPAAERERLTGALREAIATRIVPSYQRLLRFAREEYLPHARDSIAMSALPDGRAWYEWQIRQLTTTQLSPERIHELGLEEVARIGAQMDAIIHEVGFQPPAGGDGSATTVRHAFFESLRADPRFYYTTENELLEGFRAMKSEVAAQIPKLFDIAPRADFEIRPVEAFRAASAAGGSYQRASPDGSRPGIFYANTYDLKSQPKFAMESLFLHEAIPGHHFQVAIQQEQAGLPEFRRYGSYTAYVEGWALYAESLGSELGRYQDPYSRFGALSSEIFRAVRLVVDTGMHAKGWSRQQALDYMLANSAESESQASTEIDRYIAWPAQALCYKLGELKIDELKSRARRALGERFDVRAFHHEILIDGALPLEVLDTKIDRWIAAQAAGGARPGG
jgi:uncharacterized protein (DUF885 family)